MADRVGVISAATEHTEAPARTTSTAERMPGLDAARFLAAVAIVWLHAPEVPLLQRTGNPLTRPAVPFFTAAAVFLLIRGLLRDPSRSFTKYLRSRMLRLYFPFLAWAAIYYVMRQAKHALLSGAPPVRIEPVALLMGMAHHQWFLAFIFLFGVALFPIGRWIGRRHAARAPAIVLFVLLGLLAALVRPEGLDFAYDAAGIDDLRIFLRLSLDALPAGLWAAAVALYAADRPAAPRALGGIGIVAAAAGAAGIALFGRNSPSENFAGLGILLAALAIALPGRERTAAVLGGLAYGIYLSHIAFVEGIQAVAHRFVAGPRWWLDAAVFVASVAGSILLTLALQRFRSTRWLVPG